MIGRIHRFTFRSPFPKQTLSTPFFVLRYEKTKSPYCVAIVAGKKVSTSAVVRNRVKRRLSELLKPYLAETTFCTLVFYLRTPIVGATSDEIRNSLTQVLSKIGIIETQSAK